MIMGTPLAANLSGAGGKTGITPEYKWPDAVTHIGEI
jgi:hypothetical protein